MQNVVAIITAERGIHLMLVKYAAAMICVWGLVITDQRVAADDSAPSYRNPVQGYADNHPLHWYRFHEARGAQVAKDEMGRHDGVYVALTPARFNGRDDYVNLAGLDLAGNAMSILAWFQADDFDVNDARLISKASGTNNEDHYWMISTVAQGKAERLRFRLKAGGQTTELVANFGDLSAREWIFVAAVYDGHEMRLYKNGELVGFAEKEGALDGDPNVNAWIGDNPSGAGSRPFDGVIDEVALFDRALTPQQIAAIYRAALDPRP